MIYVSLMAKDHERMCAMVQQAEEFAGWVGLTFNPRKCRKLVYKRPGSRQFVCRGQVVGSLFVEVR